MLKQLPMHNLPIQPGTMIAGKYRVAELVGTGAMGAVVRAHHAILDQQVAIKLMRPELMGSAEAQSRFLREARAAARITSDYVARVNDVELLEDGTPCMVMEFLEGRTLEDAVGERLSVSWVVDRVLESLAGLAAAHALGIVHRDLKPGNIFLCTRGGDVERAKILDFGLSKILEKEVQQMRQQVGQLTTKHSLIGSPAYMSPEQIMDPTDVDERADIWAMGCIMHELLTGELVFDHDQLNALMLAILGHPAPPVSDVRADVPKGLAFVIGKCLSKDRRERFATAAELMRALAPYASARARGSLRLADDASFDDEHELASTLAATPSDELEAERASSTLPPAPTTPSPDAEVPALVIPTSARLPDLDQLAFAAPTLARPRGAMGWGATLAVTLLTALVIAVTGWFILSAPFVAGAPRSVLQAVN